MSKLTNDQVKELASKNGYEYKALKAIIMVESGGKGFADDGKIIIQFEPSWFKRRAADAKAGIWSLNKVENQVAEWKAFNDAFIIDPVAAMESTSIGLMQVMGFHWKSLSFKSAGEMWDYAKVSEANQVDIAIRFIKLNKKLDNALKTKDWATVAYYYNGEKYKQFKYDTRLATAYKNAV